MEIASKGSASETNNTMIKKVYCNYNFTASGTDNYIIIYEPGFLTPVTVYTMNLSKVNTSTAIPALSDQLSVNYDRKRLISGAIKVQCTSRPQSNLDLAGDIQVCRSDFGPA